MYSQIYDTALKFGVKPGNITRLKYFYIIHCGKEIYSLCAARPSAEKITFLHSIKEGLIKNGFTDLDRYITTQDGTPYVEEEGTIYTMTEFHSMNELDFLNNEQCLRAAAAIGCMHRASTAVADEDCSVKKYENGITRLCKAIKSAASKKNPSNMDLLLRQTFKKGVDCGTEAVEALKKYDFDSSRKIYIHNSLKEDNLIYFKGRVFLIDWDNAAVGSPAEDIAFFIRRYIRKNAYYAHKSNHSYLTLNELYSAYSCENPLTENEKEIFFALLKYPDRYIKVVEEFYRKQRSFIPASIGRKAEEICHQWDFTMDYISK